MLSPSKEPSGFSQVSSTELASVNGGNPLIVAGVIIAAATLTGCAMPYNDDEANSGAVLGNPNDKG
jgi:hypothetical protein